MRSTSLAAPDEFRTMALALPGQVKNALAQVGTAEDAAGVLDKAEWNKGGGLTRS